jgi:hypothetical protein
VFNFKVLIAALGVFFLMASGAKADVILFDNQNGFGVSHTAGGPPVATTFTLAADTYITSIDIYHFGDTQTATTVGLKVGATTVASAVAAVIDLSSSFRHFLAVFNQTFAAGTYTITDSRSEWWSYNSTSGNRGFATVYTGTPVPAPGALALLGLGLPALVGFRRKAKKA